jgi:hypothetical protein
MHDLFNGASHPNGKKYDIFNEENDLFRWMVAIFSGSGASDIIQRANVCGLKSYYPLRFNAKGEYVPLWKNYLFLEFREGVSLELCRTTSKFLRVVSARDIDSDISKPVLVRRDAIAENMKLIEDGSFNPVAHQRQFYGTGSLVKVTEGVFADRWVTLDEDVSHDMLGNQRVKIEIGGREATIELFKLAL